MALLRASVVSFVLAVITALATHINAEPTEQLVVHHACEGETFCDIRPDNYPQEEIDRKLIQHLPHLHRMRRAAPEPAAARPEGNCAVTNSKMISPYTLKNKDGVPQVIVQSQFFQQKIPQVVCSREKGECFKSYTLGIHGVKAQCMTKKMMSTLIVWDANKKETVSVATEIAIDCACVIKKHDDVKK